MNRPKVIGILGGMGPAASAETYRQVVHLCQRQFNATEDDEFPEIVVYSLPLRGFDYRGFSVQQEKNVLRQLVTALRKLETMNVEVILIDCNTVHVFYPLMQEQVRAKIINLVETTIEYCRQKGVRKVGVLCSNTSKRLHLYDQPLTNVGIESLELQPKEQKQVDKAILAVMGGKESYVHHEQLNTIMERLFDQGADAIIIGCTEISLLLKNRVDANRYIDSQWLSVQKAVVYSYSNNV